MTDRKKQPALKALKYGWALGISAALAGLVFAEVDPKWLPLVNQLIDLMQQQNGGPAAPALPAAAKR